MKCDQCDNEATLHDLKMIKGGIVSQVHLCESCAAKLGMVTQNFATVDDLIKQSIAHQASVQVSVQVQGGGRSGAGSASACASCNLTWAEFREKGLFGCPDCYTAFEARIGTLLERAHEGGTHHVGKCPSRFTEKVDHTVHLRHLRKQLDDAITAEQYEKAAQIRDSIGSYSSRFGIEPTNGGNGVGDEPNGSGASAPDEHNQAHGHDSP
jgi:protein arginine kinase activator